MVYKLIRDSKGIQEKTVNFSKFLDPNCIDKAPSKRLISSPHWNHYIDINGDCNTDLFITSRNGE